MKKIILGAVLTLFAVIIIIPSFAKGQVQLPDPWTWTREQIARIWDAIGELQNNPKQLHLVDGNGQDLGVLLTGESVARDSVFNIFAPQMDKMAKVMERDFGPNQHKVIVINTDSGALSHPILYSDVDCMGIPYSEIPHSHHSIIKNGQEWDGLTPRYYITTGEEGRFLIQSELGYNGICENKYPSEHSGYTLEEISLPYDFPLVWPLGIENM